MPSYEHVDTFSAETPVRYGSIDEHDLLDRWWVEPDSRFGSFPIVNSHPSRTTTIRKESAKEIRESHDSLLLA